MNYEDVRLVIVRGLPFSQTLQAATRASAEASPVAVDITAWEIESDAKRVATDQDEPAASAAIDFSFTVAKTTPATGFFTLGLSAVETAAIEFDRAKFDIIKRNTDSSDWELYTLGLVRIVDKITEVPE